MIRKVTVFWETLSDAVKNPQCCSPVLQKFIQREEPNQMLEIQLTFDLEENIDNLSAHLL